MEALYLGLKPDSFKGFANKYGLMFSTPFVMEKLTFIVRHEKEKFKNYLASWVESISTLGSDLFNLRWSD